MWDPSLKGEGTPAAPQNALSLAPTLPECAHTQSSWSPSTAPRH